MLRYVKCRRNEQVVFEKYKWPKMSQEEIENLNEIYNKEIGPLI